MHTDEDTSADVRLPAVTEDLPPRTWQQPFQPSVKGTQHT